MLILINVFDLEFIMSYLRNKFFRALVTLLAILILTNVKAELNEEYIKNQITDEKEQKLALLIKDRVNGRLRNLGREPTPFDVRAIISEEIDFEKYVMLTDRKDVQDGISGFIDRIVDNYRREQLMQKTIERVNADTLDVISRINNELRLQQYYSRAIELEKEELSRRTARSESLEQKEQELADQLSQIFEDLKDLN